MAPVTQSSWVSAKSFVSHCLSCPLFSLAIALFVLLFFEVPVPSQEREWSCICVLGRFFLFYNFAIGLWKTVPMLFLHCRGLLDILIIDICNYCFKAKVSLLWWTFMWLVLTIQNEVTPSRLVHYVHYFCTDVCRYHQDSFGLKSLKMSKGQPEITN